MVKLSRRLRCIADQVPNGSRLADIGSDHALLPVFLAQRGTIVSGVAGEVNKGPYEAAGRQIREAQQASVVEARHGDGLAVIEAGEVDVVTIAGMGGGLIASILDAGKGKLTGVSKLVLQPNIGEELVREWLIENNWVLTGETILEEDGKIYEVLCAVPERLAETTNEQLYARRPLADGCVLSRELLIKLGPYLTQEGPDVWHRKWDGELAKLESICRQAAQSELPSAQEKERQVRATIDSIREVMACLRKVKPLYN